ncbi:MAG: RNA methyltransferase [Lachnospiraceae bacterium]|nr:RNA methyltransferase [Lachnospiraceae bacterium]
MNIIEVRDLSDSRLDLYTRYKENQLFHIYEPDLGVFIAETPQVIERALEAGYEAISVLTEEKYLSGFGGEVLEKCGDVPIYVATVEQISTMVGYNLTRGMLCAMRRKPYPSLEEICADARRIVVLEEVVNPTNVGAIVRSAAALGMDAVVLTSGCADPLYRRAARVSMGTIFQIPWTVLPAYVENAKSNILAAIGDTDSDNHNTQGESVNGFMNRKSYWPHYGMEKLNQLGFKTVSMALRDDSVGIDDEKLLQEDKLAVIMGTEGEGLMDATIDASDYTVRIPMKHGVDSLNVAAASAVAFYQLCK